MTEEDVKPDTPSSGKGETQEPVAPPVAEPEKPQKPPEGYVPKGALDEERELRKKTQQALKEAQAKLEELESAPSEVEDVYSDEGKELKKEIGSLQDKLRSIERREARREAEAEFPFLKDKKEEFDEFLEDEENKRLSIRKAAQLFAAEKGLLEKEPERKGLEQATGGGQQIPEPTYTAEEIRDMMKNDWPRYEKLVREGKIEKLLR